MPTTLITGGNRGIGRELVRQYAAAGWTVHTTARQPSDLGAGVTVHRLDVTDFSAIAALARQLVGTPIDLLIANAGIYGGESELGALDFAVWQEVLRVNVLGPAAFAQAFAPHLAASQGRIFAVVSSGMGSIAENTSGGAYAYRSSKAAVNMLVKNLALDWQGRIRAVALCPGWVRTDMGGPGAPLDVVESVQALRAVLNRVDDQASGNFFSHTGRTLDW